MVTAKQSNFYFTSYLKAIPLPRLYTAFALLSFLVCFPTSDALADTCDNLDSGGEIGTTEVSCGPFDPVEILNLVSPSGGSGVIEYLWLKTTDPSLPRSEWDPIPNWNQPTYDPGPITQTTYFLRCSRRAGCQTYQGESNVIAMIVNGVDPQCGPSETGINLSGNASHESNSGVEASGNASGPIDGVGAKFYDGNDFMILDLNQTLSIGQKYTLSWRHKYYTSSFPGPAKVDIYESADGTNFSFNTTLTTTVKDIYITNTVTTATTTRYLKLVNPAADTPDFEVDAVVFCNTVCQSVNPQTCSLENYGETGSGNGERLLWLNFNTGVELYSVGTNGLSFVERPDGTVTINGVVEKTDNANAKYEVNARLINKRTWAEWSALGRDYKENNNVPSDHTTWDYYELDDTQSTLTGLGDNAGIDLILKHAPLDTNYAFQVGYGANVKDDSYGLSGWFNISGDLTANGDFNGDLKACSDTQLCDNLTNGGQIGNDEVVCGNGYDPAAILNITYPSGGTGNKEFIWLKSTTTSTPPTDINNDSNWSMINGADGANYDPAAINETTYFIRYARRTDCEDYFPSNVVTKAVNPQVEISNIVTEQVSCHNGTDGFIDLSITGGTAPFNFAWSNGAGNVEDIDNLTTGNYTVTVTDAKSCSTTTSIFIEEPTALDLNINEASVDCFGDQTANVDLGVTGGTSPYSFTWSNGATTSNQDNLGMGTYVVTVTDANGCTAVTETEITGPAAALSCTTTSSNVTCFDSNDGTASVAVNGGTAPYTYLWSNGSDSPTLQQLTAGDYFVTVTDAKACICISQLGISQPTEIGLTATQENVACNGGDNGSINLTVAGGNTPYLFSWSNGATTEDLQGLSAGTYTVTVYDANQCAANLEVNISEAGDLDLTTTLVNPTCFGEDNGSINLDITGGQSPYDILWSNGATTADLENLAEGGYVVTVTDANGCNTNLQTALVSPTAINLIATPQDLTCNDAQNGSITLTVAGGTEPYSFDWSNGATTQNIDGLSVNEYQVVVTDANGCVASVTKIVDAPDAIALEATTQDINCGSAQNGSIDLSITGGTEPFSYNWSNGATTQDLQNLPAGTYEVTVTDANDCHANLSLLINATDGIELDATTEDLTCNDAQNGSIELSITGGTAPFSYDWSNGATTQNIDGLSANEYQVFVVDANGCTASLTLIINAPNALSLAATTQDLTCNDAQNGSIDLSVAGGTAPYSYDWSNGATSQDLEGLSANEYQVIVTDANGCTDDLTLIINAPTAIILEATTQDISCNNGQNGNIDLNITGGTTPYSYSWNNGADTQDLQNLPAGTYEVTVTDANGCTENLAAIINAVGAIELTATTQDLTCNDAQNGSIDLSVAGGTAPYSYDWSNGATTQNIDGLSANEYQVFVVDANGCTASLTFIINAPNALNLAATTQDLTCNDAQNGSIDLSVTGGTAPYSYDWSNGATSQDLEGLSANEYQVIVTDANGCTDDLTLIINAPAAIAATTSVQDVLCNGGQTGSISLTTTGGTIPYSFAWDNGAITPELQGLAVGIYTVTITDANGCTFLTEAEVNGTTALTLNFEKTDASCAQGTDGAIDLTITGGTTPYFFQWSNGSTSEDLDNLAAGTYTVLVNDQNQCTTELEIVITEPAALSTTLATENVACNGGDNGSIDLTITGGTAPYTVSWSNGATTEDLNGLMAGSYTAVITDANNCETTATGSIDQAGSLSVSPSVTDADCQGSQTGSIDLQITGGMPPYSISWNNGATTSNLDGLSAGDYNVIVTDANGCETAATATVNEATAISATTEITTVSCANDNDGSIELTITGGTAPYSIVWNTGATTTTLAGLTAGMYSVVITDANGCTTELNQLMVTAPNQIAAVITTTDVSCNGGQDGTAVVTVTGGTPPYAYLWNNGGISDSIDGLIIGVYGVLVTDANGCTTNMAMPITQPEAITIEATTNDASCHDAQDGSINLSVEGGTTPYNFTWGNGANTADLDGLSSGDYNVTVVDANGCAATTTVSVTAPTPIEVETAVTTFITNAGTSTGAVSATALGGIAPYTYAWSNGENGAAIQGLAAGTYEVTVTDANGCIAIASITLLDAAKIGNRVWNDLNGNGIQEQGENGVVGISIKLTGTDPQGNLFSLVTTTNGLGEYCFDGLLPGQYSLKFTLDNGFVFSQPFLGGNTATDSDVNPTDGKTGTITVDYGTINNDIDAGIYLPGKIGDFVWEDSNGDGIQDANEPGLNDIEVILTGTSETGESITMTTTSGPNPANATENGFYSFEGLAPGNYTISFNATSNYFPSPMDQTTEDTDSDINDMNTTGTINVVSGTNNTSVDAGFFRSAKLGNLVWYDLNRNGIQDPEDTGVIGVVANLIDLGADGAIGGGDDALVTVISTASDGTYCFADVAPGRYAIRFKPNSLPDGYKFTLQDQTDDDKDSDADPLTGFTAPITISSGQNNLSFDAGIVTTCDDLSFGGTIGDDESSCGAFDPAAITEVAPATGGSGTIAYQWYESTVENPSPTINPTDWTLIQGATGMSYDPDTIQETTHYVRTAKRDGCIAFVVTSNIVSKSIVEADLNVEVDLTNNRCIGSTIDFIAYSSATDITVTWMFFDGDTDNTLLLDELEGEEASFSYEKAGDKLIRVTVVDEVTGCAEVVDFMITILPANSPICSVLPFSPAFTGFEASVVNEEFVRLDWTIVDGDEYLNFELERSPNGEVYEVIAAVFGQNEIIQYDYLDRSPFIGRNFYRIKYIRADGTVFYSNAASVIIDSRIDANIFPNPTQDYSNINFTNTIRENSILEVVNANGQVMETTVLGAGTTYTQIDLTAYQPGMYYIYLQTNSRRDLIQQILKVAN